MMEAARREFEEGVYRRRAKQHIYFFFRYKIIVFEELVIKFFVSWKSCATGILSLVLGTLITSSSGVIRR